MYLLRLSLLALLLHSGVPKVDIQWIYIRGELAWQSPPKDPELADYETAFAPLAIFYPTGEFVRCDFWIARSKKDQPIFITPGQGFAIRKGTWTSNTDGSIKVTYQLVYEEGLPKQPVPGAMEEERWILHGKFQGRLAARLESPSGDYVPLSALSNLKTLNDIIHDAVKPTSAAP
jgi:hypothetical protein